MEAGIAEVVVLLVVDIAGSGCVDAGRLIEELSTGEARVGLADVNVTLLVLFLLS